MLDNLKNYNIILASNSPRRRQLLGGLDINFTVKVFPNISEAYPPDTPASEIPVCISREKAEAYRTVISPHDLVITADTVVIVDNTVLGKPVDADEACRMLRMISGRTHKVVTGVCLTTATFQRCFSVATNVTFRPLSDSEIDYYVEKYRPFDKAGAYGIQEWIGYVGVTKIDGSYFNVMGLPVQRIYDELKTLKLP